MQWNLKSESEKTPKSSDSPIPRELPPTQFTLENARDLIGHVSRRIPATTLISNNNNHNGDDDGCEEEDMFYEKIIVIKVSNALLIIMHNNDWI